MYALAGKRATDESDRSPAGSLLPGTAPTRMGSSMTPRPPLGNQLSRTMSAVDDLVSGIRNEQWLSPRMPKLRQAHPE